MEHGNGARGLISSTVHLANADGNHQYSVGRQTIQNEATEFHLYRMDWNENRIDFYVDDIRHHGFALTENMPFHQPFFFFHTQYRYGGFIYRQHNRSRLYLFADGNRLYSIV